MMHLLLAVSSGFTLEFTIAPHKSVRTGIGREYHGPIGDPRMPTAIPG